MPINTKCNITKNLPLSSTELSNSAKRDYKKSNIGGLGSAVAEVLAAQCKSLIK